MSSSKKLNQRGSFFVEYALILAFVVICGSALLSNNEISLKINNIITSTTDLLQKAVGMTGSANASNGEQGNLDTENEGKSEGMGGAGDLSQEPKLN